VTVGVVFDVDDTLCLERDFVASGFRSVADLIALHTGLPSEPLFDFLWDGFLAGRRGTAFDALLAEYPEVTEAFMLSDLVTAYRAHQPVIALLPEVKGLLQSLRERSHPVGVITDGPPESQRAKIRALGLESLADPLVTTGDWGPDFSKPHPRAFEVIEAAWDMSGSELAYIADNPTKDFITPKQRGWHTIRVRHPGQLHYGLDPASAEYAPDAECSSVLGAHAMLMENAA
jgi:putative hydrolase of the HAD superfamily